MDNSPEKMRWNAEIPGDEFENSLRWPAPHELYGKPAVSLADDRDESPVYHPVSQQHLSFSSATLWTIQTIKWNHAWSAHWELFIFCTRAPSALKDFFFLPALAVQKKKKKENSKCIWPWDGKNFGSSENVYKDLFFLLHLSTETVAVYGSPGPRRSAEQSYDSACWMAWIVDGHSNVQNLQ